MGIFDWFKGWGNAIKMVNYVSKVVSTFPENEKYVKLLIENEDKWKDEKEIIKKQIIEGYSKKINYENVKTFGKKYLDFYSKIFPNLDNSELLNLYNIDLVEAEVLEKVNDDDALDPTEISEIISLSKKLKVEEFNTIEKIKEKFSYYITNWELDNGIFPNFSSDFILQKNEQCIFKEKDVELIEQKSVLKRINYGGPRMRIKIAKGLSYNLGSYNVQMEKEIKQISKGKGDLNITTKRLLFKSNEKSVTIRLSSIIDIQPYEDAIIVNKSNGNPIIFKVTDGVKAYQFLNGAIRNL